MTARRGARSYGELPARSGLLHWPQLLPSLSSRSAATGTPPTVISNPPRQWGRHAPPNIYPDPDVIVIDPSFAALRVGNNAIHRIATGFTWAEGPAWSSEGQYFVFSDVVANTQYRVLWDDRRVTPFRKPSNNSNGNSFDFQGRQLSTEDFNRRVVRWEHDGTMTVIADQFDGKPLNSPNDLVPHPDGSIWFTDPPYGDQLARGPSGRCWWIGQPAKPAQTRRWCSECRSDRRQEARTAERSLSLGPERPPRSGDHRGSAQGSERAVLLARLQDALCVQHR